jgi:GDP-L-fucose synthase
MKKLITGGFGLIGSEFSEGIKIKREDCNLIIPEEVNNLLLKTEPDYVIHTAAKVGGVGANMNFKASFFYENIMMNTNIIHYSWLNKVKKLISFSSTCVFPNDIEYPITEDKIHLGPPHFSNDAYAYAKRMVDIQNKAYNEQYGTKYFSVIPTNVYGPNDNYNLENAHVIPSMIHKCYNAIIEKKDLVFWGDGTPLREFVFSKDVANICDLLLEKYDDFSPIIISTCEEYSIKEIANRIAKLMGYKKNIKWDKTKPNGQLRKSSDNSKLLSIIKDYKFKPLDEGLIETIDFFLKNYPNVRK